MQPTILLVEDDAVLRRGLTELFTREGCRVIEAASVREAKEKLIDTLAEEANKVLENQIQTIG